MKTYLRFGIIQLLGFVERLFSPNGVLVANFGPGTHEHGVVTKAADVATIVPAGNTVGPDRFHIGAVGAGGATTVRDCTSQLEPRYLIRDQAMAAAELVECRILGLGAGTDKAMADASINFGDLLVPSSNNAGYVMSLPVTPGTYWVVGRCICETGAVQYDDFEFAPCKPYQITVHS
jgi:hypothetical protein